MKKAFALLFLISILLRLWLALGYWAGKPLTQDAKEYLELANNYNSTGAFQYDEHHTLQIESYGRAPGYPYWLALMLRVQPTLAWIRVMEVVINLCSAWLFFLLGREVFGFRPGISAFIVAAFYVPFVSLIPPVLSENLWICTMLPAYLYLFRSRREPDNQPTVNMAAATFFLALATLIRPGAVFLLPFFGYWFFRNIGWKNSALGIALYFLFLLPWNLHMYFQEGRVVFVASEGGVTFWTGTHPEYSGDGDLAVNPGVQKEYREILKSHAGETPSMKEKLFYTDGLANILDHPGSYALGEGKKLVFGFLPFGASVLQTSLLHRITGIAFYLALLALAIPAIRHAPADARILLAGVAGSYTVLILLFFPQERFRIAMLDPLLMLFAASEISRRFKNI